MKKTILTKNRNMKNVALVLTSILFLGLTSCNFDKRMQEQEKDLIANFIQANNITVAPTESGLYFIEELVGEGPMPEDYDSVYVHYRTLLLSGQLIDESTGGDPFGFIIGVNQAIPGFEEGIKLMHEGGKADLIIPSKLAYGSQGAGGVVGSYTPLLIEIELVKVVAGPFIP